MNKIPVLKIRDGNGNFIPINAIRGDKGKSAYEQAKDGGYTGTEEEFIALLNGLTATIDAQHYADLNNPHKVTAEQTGALPTQYPTSTDLNTELTMGGNRSAIHCYYELTLNTPYKEGKTDCTHGMVITNAQSSQYATQMCMPSGEDAIYVRRLNGQGISSWVKMAYADSVKYIFNHEYGGVGAGLQATAVSGFAGGQYAETEDGGALGYGAKSAFGGAVGSNAIAGFGFSGGCRAQTIKPNGEVVDAIQLGEGENPNEKTLQVYNYPLMDAEGKIVADRLPFASGSYKGTNDYGVSKPNTLTFDFVPRFVIVSKRGETNVNGGATFIWINAGTTLNFINNGSTYWCHPTLNGKTLSWWNAESASYQLNSSLYEYDYFAWG